MNITEDMHNMEKYSKDQLEEEDKIVRCKHCYSLNIKDDEIQGEVVIEWCGDCGTTDYTEVVLLEEHLKEVNS